jgi:hypothetical protein
MNNANPRLRNPQQIFHLARCESGNGDNQVGSFRRQPGLLGKARAELRRRVLSRHHEQVVKRRHHSFVPPVDTLIQTMEQSHIEGPILPQQYPTGVAGGGEFQAAQEAVGTKAE